jgi:hypothetical protein
MFQVLERGSSELSALHNSRVDIYTCCMTVQHQEDDEFKQNSKQKKQNLNEKRE